MSPDDQSGSSDGLGQKGMSPGEKRTNLGQGPPKAHVRPTAPPPKPSDAGASAKPGPSNSK